MWEGVYNCHFLSTQTQLLLTQADGNMRSVTKNKMKFKQPIIKTTKFKVATVTKVKKGKWTILHMRA